MKKILLAFCLGLIVVSCGPKAVEETVEVEKPVINKPTQKRTTDCVVLDDLKGYIKEDIQTAYVLYRDQVKFKNLDAAYPLWSKAFHAAPGGNGKIKYHYNDGVEIFKHLFTTATTSDDKRRFLDSMNMVYDQRVTCYGEASYVAGRKAFDYYYTFSDYVDPETTFSLFLENLQEKKEKADYFIINPMTRMLFDKVVRKEIDNQEGRRYAKMLLAAVENGLATCKGKNCEAWEIINDYAPSRLEALEGVDDFYDCEYYNDKYYPQFIADSDNCETIELVYRRLLRGNCDSTNQNLVEVKNAKATKCYVPPPPPGPLKQAFNAYNAGDYRNAVSLFENFVELTDDNEKKAKYLLLIAKIYYRDLKDYPSSRKYALDAAALKDNWGEPYMLIGKLYASSGPLCGPGRGWDSQIVTWPAIDMFEKARAMDTEVAAEAGKLIRDYRQYMPKKEDVFFRTLNIGDSFRVGCWIQRNTTIRTAD